jgi:hypothetical protein
MKKKNIKECFRNKRFYFVSNYIFADTSKKAPGFSEAGTAHNFALLHSCWRLL